MALELVMPGEPSSRLEDVLSYALEGVEFRRVEDISEIKPGPVLFAAAIDETGKNRSLYELVCKLRANGAMLDGTIGGIIIDGAGELYTKACARELALAANSCGCALIGRSLVEGTGSLDNYLRLCHVNNTNKMDAYRQSARELIKRLVSHKHRERSKANILTLYASSRAKSNTYALYNMVKRELPPQCDCTEIMIRNGAVADCEGCSYTACLHFGEHGKCFYGGVIVDEVFPALNECDALMLLCPNYNDAADANITALINRMTALTLVTRFFDKPVYAIVVSGYSGSDIVASQLIGALNMNRSFILPPRFCMKETANDPARIFDVEGIEERALNFANSISEHLFCSNTPVFY